MVRFTSWPAPFIERAVGLFLVTQHIPREQAAVRCAVLEVDKKVGHGGGVAREEGEDCASADKKDSDALLANGWQIVDAKQVADSPEAFRRYVQSSSAEFSVAQGIYVDTNSGWFSDRTVRYLASGKPALVQDTGFSRHIPVGEGFARFSHNGRGHRRCQAHRP